jgi:hypothetical protein
MKEAKSAAEKAVYALMEEKTRLLTQARALDEMGMQEGARPLWHEIATREERIAPLLDALGAKREAAVHRISAASSYERTGDDAQAANLYQAALAGPLLETTRRDVEEMLERCLMRLATETAPTRRTRSRRTHKGIAAT